MRLANTRTFKHAKLLTTFGKPSVIAAGALCAVALAARTAFAAATTPVPDGLVDLTTSSAGCFAQSSGTHSSYPGYKAFDNGSKTSEGSRWLATVAANMYVTYKFKVATVVNGIGILIPPSLNCETRAPKNWTFSGSNDGENWTTLDTQSDETGWADNEFRYYYFANSDSYLYYKFNCTANNGATDYMQVQEIEFYGPEQDLPVFTDLTTSSATSSAGSVTEYTTAYANNNYNGTKAFDNGVNLSDPLSRFLANYNTGGMYVTYKFKLATAVNGIGIQLPFDGGDDYSSRAPKTWTFSGSNDGKTWTTLDTRTDETGWSKGEFRHYEFRALMPFQYYKFNCTALNGSTACMQIIELEFYYSEPDGPNEATWTGAGETDSLSDAGNWDSGIPGLSTFATIAATGNKDAVVPGGPMAISRLYLGSADSAVLRQTNGLFAVLGDYVTIGRLAGGNGLLSISGGTFVSTNKTANNKLFLGAKKGTGTIEVSGSGRMEVDLLQMGFGTDDGSVSHGIVRLSENGEFRTGKAIVGESSKTLGEVFISGNGTFFSKENIEMGYNAATGMVFQAGGACHCGIIIFVGYEPGGVGRYEMTGGACNADNGLSVGRYGTGTFVVSGSGTVLTVGSSELGGVRIGFSLSNHAGTGTLVVTNGGKVVAKSFYRGSGADANQAYVTFDEGVLQATADTATFLNNLANIDLKEGGLAIESEGHDLGITNCTFNVTPGAKISVTGGGTMTFTDTTVNLAERPTRGFTLAETDGTFSGLPTPSGSGGWKLKMSNDAKRIRILPSGLMIIVH